MDFEAIKALCRTLPGNEEDLKWGQHLTFMVAKKMYAIYSLDEAFSLSLKTNRDQFDFLTARDHIVPAPYLARYDWIQLQQPDAVPPDEFAQLIRESYHHIFSRLPKKRQKEILEENV